MFCFLAAQRLLYLRVKATFLAQQPPNCYSVADTIVRLANHLKSEYQWLLVSDDGSYRQGRATGHRTTGHCCLAQATEKYTAILVILVQA